MKTTQLPPSAPSDSQATGSQLQQAGQSSSHYLTNDSYLNSDNSQQTGHASKDKSYQEGVSNFMARNNFVSNAKATVMNTDNAKYESAIDSGYKKAVKNADLPLATAYKSSEYQHPLDNVTPDNNYSDSHYLDNCYSDKFELNNAEPNNFEPSHFAPNYNADNNINNPNAPSVSATNNCAEIPERVFMNGLIKHTAIALAIIVPLAAFSAYAATPPITPLSTMNMATSNAAPDKASTATLAVEPSSIIHNSASTPTTVDSVDLEQYAGTWYEIGRLPMYFQRNCARDVTATYTGKTDGSGIIVLNQCTAADGTAITAEGLAKVADSTGSKLKVTFLPAWIRWLPVGRADYWVLARDADYQTALVGTPDHKYLWLLSRSPNISQQTYAKYRQIAQQQGYELKEFKLTTQTKQTVTLIP
jgi:apolipoprotein D and lipocalin family protein